MHPPPDSRCSQRHSRRSRAAPPASLPPCIGTSNPRWTSTFTCPPAGRTSAPSRPPPPSGLPQRWRARRCSRRRRKPSCRATTSGWSRGVRPPAQQPAGARRPARATRRRTVSPSASGTRECTSARQACAQRFFANLRAPAAPADEPGSMPWTAAVSSRPAPPAPHARAHRRCPRSPPTRNPVRTRRRCSSTSSAIVDDEPLIVELLTHGAGLRGLRGERRPHRLRGAGTGPEHASPTWWCWT